MGKGKLIKKQSLKDKLLGGNCILSFKGFSYEVRVSPENKDYWDVYTEGRNEFICFIRRVNYPYTYYTISCSNWGASGNAFYQAYNHIISGDRIDDYELILVDTTPRIIAKKIVDKSHIKITSDNVYSGTREYKGD